MAAPPHKSILESSKNVLISPWKGKLTIQGCVLCDITLWSSYGTVIPAHLPHELHFKYVMRVSSLKERLPEAAFRKQIYLEQKVCCQDLCFNLYEVELSNKQGEEVDKLTEYIKNKQLALIKCLEDRAFFILLSSSALIPEPDTGDEQMSLHVLHLFHSHLATEVKDLKIEDDISWKVAPILPALNCALLEAKKLLPEEGTHPNILVKHNFQELNKVDKNLSLTAAPQDVKKETTFFRKLSGSFDLVPPPEKCSTESLTQLKSYFSDPGGYTLEVSTALGLLAECPPSPYISDGICDAGFSLVMTPDPEFLDSEAEVRKKTQTEKSSEEMFKEKKGAVVPLSAASNLRVQPKRKASMLPIVRSKRVNLCPSFAKRTTPGTDSRSSSPSPLKLVKGQLPQKRKRGAEVVTAQVVQKTKLNRKSQEVPISKDVPVATNTKRARRQEKSPIKTVPRAKPPVKKSPQKRRVNIVKGSQNPRIGKQPQPAKEETALQLQSEISSDGQKDGISMNTAQSQSITVAQKDLPENSIINYDSQALNMLADLALSSAASSTPLCEARNLPCSSELPQNDVLHSKESSLCDTSDHDYHSGVKSQKGILLSKSSCDQKSNSGLDLTASHEEENLVPCSQTPPNAQSALREETEPSGTSQNSLITVEHSYALLLGENSKKHLQQRGLPGPAFAKTGTKGPEAGTPVGKVMPFRHLQNTSPLQKLSEDSLVKHRGRFISSNLKNIFCSHTIISCDGSFKITFKCETEYAFNLDSKYTNNPLEKTVVRALHGPWNTNLPDNMEEVKLLIHMWVALFYRNRNKVIQSSRKVVEHSNPEKYVSINSTLESFELSEIEESSSVERCSIEPLLETKEMSRAHANEVSFHGPKCLLPLIKLPPSRGLELCVENERKEIFARECHLDNSESQNFIHSCNDEVVGGKAKQESANKLEASNLVLSVIGNTQTNGPFSSDEDETFQSVDSKRVVSYNDTGTQATFTRTYDGASSQSEMCEKSVYIPLESRVDILHTTVQTNTNALQDLIQCSSPINNECESSLEKTDDNMEYVMINLEPVTFTLEKDACVPVHTEVNRGEKPLPFSSELINQMLPAADVRHPISALEEAQTQAVRDIPSLAMAGQKSTKYLSASSGKREILDEELLLSQKEMTLPVSSPSSDKALIMEALSLVKCSSYPLPSEEMKHSQDICLQTQNLFSISSEEIIEPSQIEVVSPSVSASLGKRYSNDCVPPKTNIPDDSLELRKNDKSSLNCENVNLESFNAVFAKQTNLLINGQEIGLELQEENSDIDLTLTISPPTSPRGKVPANETKQLQEATGSNLELKDIAEEIIEPKEVTLIEKTEENPASSMSAYSTVSKEPLENERKGDSLQPITLILSKENCTLEIGEEINVTSDFPYGSLIEEVSPSSSPDPLVPIEEARPSQVVSPCSLKLHGTQCEKSNKFSQIESEDIAVTEKENSFVDPSHLVRQENTTQLQQIQLSVKMPLILTNHPGRKGRLMFPGKITEEIVPREHGEGLSFSEKVQCYGTELNKPGLIANYGDNFKPSLEKLVKSGNPLQPISIENRNLGLKHLVLESHEPSFSSRKSIENKSLAEALVSTTSLSGIVNIPLKEQGSPESIKEKLCNSDLKTDGGSYMQVKSVSSVSIDEADVTQAYLHPEIPEFGSASDSATFTQCTRPESIEPGFQTQEIPVIRMASLFGNSRTEAELHEEGTDVDAISLQSNSTASTKGEEKTVHTLSDTSVCEMKELLKGEFMPTYACSYQSTIDTSEEPSAFVSESIETLVYGVSKEHIDRKTTSEGHRNEADAKILDRNVDANMNSDKHYEPLSGDSDQDSFNNCRNPRLDMENSGILGSYTSKNEHAAKDGYYSLMCLNNSDNEACDYSNKVPGVKMNIPPRNWATGLKKADECMPHYVQIRDRHGILRTYANFTVTRELKDMTRTLHRVRRHPSFTLNSDLSSWMSTWQVADDLTQNTLDLEYLRFTHKIKQLVKKEGSRQTDSPLEILLRDFPLTEKSEPPVLHPTPRNRSPILVTVMHTDARWQSCHRSGHTPSDLDSSSSFWKERCSHSRNLTNSQRKQTVSFHLNKLKYNSTLKESRNDISLILNEYAEFNKVVMNSNYADFQDKELNMASEEATFQETYPSFSRQSTSYEDIITDLCASLHTKLNSVLKEACKSPFFFYLVETGDKPFFLRTKSILRKGGHTEIEPQHFCHTFHRENDTLVVIIRNEDISSHLHQIPSLLKLKHLPGVIFAGVDNPEDVLNDTHQELFHTGGFVVSDDKILETVTLAQLKEIVKILEKLNGNGRWKWLLHYRENKKLKEDVRMDSVAHKKNLILRSYQSANIIELLPYHQCDSQSQTKAEILKCLINLQIQHVDARFAVFLTDKHISSEVFGNNGILATDVNNFIENIQKIAAPFRSSYW